VAPSCCAASFRRADGQRSARHGPLHRSPVAAHAGRIHGQRGCPRPGAARFNTASSPALPPRPCCWPCWHLQRHRFSAALRTRSWRSALRSRKSAQGMRCSRFRRQTWLDGDAASSLRRVCTRLFAHCCSSRSADPVVICWPRSRFFCSPSRFAGSARPPLP